MSRLKTFERQVALQARLKGRPLLHEVVDTDEVEVLLGLEVDQGRLASMDYKNEVATAFQVPNQSPEALVSDLEQAFNDNRVDDLLQKTQKDLICAIAGPFGLGKFVALYDKHGGNVDTVYNVRNNVYATEHEKTAYDVRGAYDTDAVHKHANYIETNRRHSQDRKHGDGVADAYSGEVLGKHDHMDLDHVVSGKKTHDDRGRVLAGLKTEDVANIDENLTPTHRSINRSKRDKDPEVFARYLEMTAEARKNKIAELSTREGSLTDKERKELGKLRKLETAKPGAIREEAKKARAAQDSKISRAYYTSGKFIGNTVLTGVAEGGKMGAQQALGLLLMELFDGLILEARDVFHNGTSKDGLFVDLRTRFGRVVKKVAARWKDALRAFFDGGLSGFLSNLITTIINALVTTGARVVRMIREGMYSLFRAVKLVLFPPDNLTPREACHEALKLLVAGGIVVGGMALEEVVEKAVSGVAFLAPIAPMLTAVIVGTTTTLAMALSAYLIDKADVLGAIRMQRDAFVLETLDNDITTKLERALCLGDELDKLLADPTPVG